MHDLKKIGSRLPTSPSVFPLSPGFLPGDLFSYRVDPLLVAIATFESMLTDSHTQQYDGAVELLESIHSRVPDVGWEKQYTKLLVDLKTKVLIPSVSQIGRWMLDC